MKFKVSLGALLLLAIALRYVLGTENGRAQRDAVLARMGRKKTDESEAAADDPAPDEESASDSLRESEDVGLE